MVSDPPHPDGPLGTERRNRFTCNDLEVSMLKDVASEQERRAVSPDGLGEPLFPDLFPPRPEGWLAEFVQAVKVTGGIQAPLHVDEDFRIIDGWARLQAARLLGIRAVPVIICVGLDSEQKRQLAILLNCARRHLTRKELVGIIEAELLRRPAISTRYLAELCGTNHSLVHRVKKRLIATGCIPKKTTSEGRESRLYRFPKIFVRGRKERNLAADAVPAAKDDLPEWSTVRTVRRKALEKRYEEARQGDTPPNPHRQYKLYNCRFQELLDRGHVSPGTVNLIFTDPLYAEDHLADWSDLADFAHEALTDDGLLVGYSGVRLLPDIMRRLGSRLCFVWQAVITYRIGNVEQTTASVSLYRPVLLFAKRPHRFEFGFRDSVPAGVREEKCHPYQQDLEAAKGVMRQLLRPKTLVCDPCLGSGTFLLALHELNLENRLGCRFVGCDMDSSAVGLATARLTDAARTPKT